MDSLFYDVGYLTIGDNLEDSSKCIACGPMGLDQIKKGFISINSESMSKRTQIPSKMCYARYLDYFIRNEISCLWIGRENSIFITYSNSTVTYIVLSRHKPIVTEIYVHADNIEDYLNECVEYIDEQLWFLKDKMQQFYNSYDFTIRDDSFKADMRKDIVSFLPYKDVKYFAVRTNKSACDKFNARTDYEKAYVNFLLSKDNDNSFVTTNPLWFDEDTYNNIKTRKIPAILERIISA